MWDAIVVVLLDTFRRKVMTAVVVGRILSLSSSKDVMVDVMDEFMEGSNDVPLNMPPLLNTLPLDDVEFFWNIMCFLFFF